MRKSIAHDPGSDNSENKEQNSNTNTDEVVTKGKIGTLRKLFRKPSEMYVRKNY